MAEPIPAPPVALPALGTYPATGTDVAKDQWLRLADLYVREAQRVTSWAATQASADATLKLASANGAMASAATDNMASLIDALPPVVTQVIDQWQAHDEALNGLATAIAGIQLTGGNAGGVSSADFVAVLLGILAPRAP